MDTPCWEQVDELYAGEVGYFSAAIKSVADARVGDTVTSRKGGATQVPATSPPTHCSCSVSRRRQSSCTLLCAVEAAHAAHW